jgi:hypothetical protein
VNINNALIHHHHLLLFSSSSSWYHMFYYVQFLSSADIFVNYLTSCYLKCIFLYVIFSWLRHSSLLFYHLSSGTCHALYQASKSIYVLLDDTAFVNVWFSLHAILNCTLLLLAVIVKVQQF